MGLFESGGLPHLGTSIQDLRPAHATLERVLLADHLIIIKLSTSVDTLNVPSSHLFCELVAYAARFAGCI